MIVGLQEPAILVENFVGTVAGQALEGRVGIDEDAVIAFLLGHDDAVIGGFDHQLQEFGVDHGLGSRWFVGLPHSVVVSDSDA
ncbi:hypothetical protein D3C80_1865870 [compost metagenome]